MCVLSQWYISNPINGDLNKCEVMLPSGSSCQPLCDDGYTPTGPMMCTNDQLLSQTVCEESSCDASALVKLALDLGDCSANLQSGNTCIPVCKNGYAVWRDLLVLQDEWSLFNHIISFITRWYQYRDKWITYLTQRLLILEPIVISSQLTYSLGVTQTTILSHKANVGWLVGQFFFQLHLLLYR